MANKNVPNSTKTEPAAAKPAPGPIYAMAGDAPMLSARPMKAHVRRALKNRFKGIEKGINSI
jgi:hypothetical protein